LLPLLLLPVGHRVLYAAGLQSSSSLSLSLKNVSSPPNFELGSCFVLHRTYVPLHTACTRLRSTQSNPEPRCAFLFFAFYFSSKQHVQQPAAALLCNIKKIEKYSCF
jgi:hypothetical protein